MRIGLLNNLRAGRSNAQVKRLLDFLGQHPDVLHVETDCAEAVPEALADLGRQEIDILVVNGGDGTLQHALTEVLDCQPFEGRIPMIAPICGGRTNMTAKDLGASRDPVKGVAALIASTKDGRLGSRMVHRKVLRVEYGPYRDVAYGMFYGGGVLARAIELNHRLFKKDRALTKGKVQGALGASIVTAILLMRSAFKDNDGVLSPDKMQILLDGDLLDKGEFRLVMGSTLTHLFSGLEPFWGEGPGGVRFTTIGTHARQFARFAPGILRGRPNQSLVTPENGYTSHNVDSAVLRLDCAFTVDGEIFEAQSGRIVAITADRRVQFVRA